MYEYLYLLEHVAVLSTVFRQEYLNDWRITHHKMLRTSAPTCIVYYFDTING